MGEVPVGKGGADEVLQRGASRNLGKEAEEVPSGGLKRVADVGETAPEKEVGETAPEKVVCETEVIDEMAVAGKAAPEKVAEMAEAWHIIWRRRRDNRGHVSDFGLRASVGGDGRHPTSQSWPCRWDGRGRSRHKRVGGQRRWQRKHEVGRDGGRGRDVVEEPSTR